MTLDTVTVPHLCLLSATLIWCCTGLSDYYTYQMYLLTSQCILSLSNDIIPQFFLLSLICSIYIYLGNCIHSWGHNGCKSDYSWIDAFWQDHLVEPGINTNTFFIDVIIREWWCVMVLRTQPVFPKYPSVYFLFHFILTVQYTDLIFPCISYSGIGIARHWSQNPTLIQGS